MTIPEDLLDALMKDYKNPEDLIWETGLLKQFTKHYQERAIQAEMTDHLGYEKNAPARKKTNNSRNGSYKKQVKESSAISTLTFPVTSIPILSLSSFPGASVASPVSMTI
jgi:putative transposase